ncbi:hypothetical protein AAFF_G00391420 [Aldrovandia affinis]|uniref:Uncharacterized protein n=1 Tax=Aldrovandia affinis TaxID=143900 RepID=A0AAD7SEB9_9TELE|nr:hypothetical protein AAFF_G00391420 [Aldrovandia affinis]
MNDNVHAPCIACRCTHKSARGPTSAPRLARSPRFRSPVSIPRVVVTVVNSDADSPRCSDGTDQPVLRTLKPRTPLAHSPRGHVAQLCQVPDCCGVRQHHEMGLELTQVAANDGPPAASLDNRGTLSDTGHFPSETAGAVIAKDGAERRQLCLVIADP